MPTEEFEMIGRRPIYVYLKTMRQARNLTKFGDVIYTSKVDKFVCLYARAVEISKLQETLAAQNYVTDVKIGGVAELSDDFAAAFSETNEAIKNDLPGLE
ncbi:MAG: DUF2129 domain-containing protein [Streptococcaceae bacterium]|jgi:uncharacterized protein YlbG (UPF0298 family)|nr:DUF2129 domain-containing protein [Streptococcaceae bacterium]